MGDQPAVEAVGLVKSYGSVKVLDGVDVLVPRGTVFALLGPNGAGKTTMVRILATLTTADAGTARVAGFDVVRDRRRVRRSISLTGQDISVDELLTGEENLRMMARLHGMSRAESAGRARRMLERFDLTDAGRRRVGTYSGGMRRRLDLAASLVREPEVIFLDEPTTGLDLRARQAAWQVIAGLTGAGTTVFLTTQYLEEADRLADRIALLDEGRVVAEGSPADLKGRVAEQRLDLTFTDETAYADALRRLGDRASRPDRGRLTMSAATDGTAAHVRAVLDEIDPHGGGVHRFALHTASLDDVFLTLTGRRPRAGGPAERKETAGV
jgi:ABC-2 type transport system ATP-binding protein